MARKPKEGIDYFSFDVDFFENKKVRKVLRACGPASGTILSYLLCNIYRWKGYYTVWDDDLSFDVIDSVGASEGQVKETVNKLLQVGFFSQKMYQEYGILTSYEIQCRYRSGTTKRVDVKLDERFIIQEEEAENIIYAGSNSISTGRNEDNDGGSTQSIVKDSIVNKSKVKTLSVGASANEQAEKEARKKYVELTAGLINLPVHESWTKIKDFINEEKPQWIDPYADLWNIFSKRNDLATVSAITPGRVKKFKTRISEVTFDFIRILKNIQESTHLKGDNNAKWKVTFDWIFENDKNYLKILEGNYA